jgi:nitrite reductase/ring-hydroxylating ferredoxin subunit
VARGELRTRAERDDHTFRENLGTQPLVRHRIFNNKDVLTAGWYPVCAARDLERGQARSFLMTYQRIVVFRGEDGTVRAFDAFCPHMGADLGNGRVVGNELQCYFHQWQFDGCGTLVRMGKKTRSDPEAKFPKRARLASYPVEEKYGAIWVYSAETADHPLPTCPGLDDAPVRAYHLGKTRLYAHHHVMMAGGIDLRHFETVHNFNIDFELDITEKAGGVADWNLSGELPTGGWRSRLGRYCIGPTFRYALRVAGGTVAAITYGRDAHWRGGKRRLPSLHILWGCRPLATGVSEVEIFVLVRKHEGFFGWLWDKFLTFATVMLLAILRDDDVKAFPHMRFSPTNLAQGDESVARFIQFVNSIKPSAWSRQPDDSAQAPRG